MSPSNILYEDEYFLVLDKPHGIVVNLSETTKAETLQNFLQSYLSTQLSLVPEAERDSEFYMRSGIVHRLDKDTSGVLVVAKNENVFKNLQKQFKKHTVEKEYVAIVIGELKDKLIEINAPIKRNPEHRFRYAVVKEGKDAVTRVEALEVRDGLSKVRVFPKTGRTHQIRVHMAALGHPVVGDPIYCTKKQLEFWQPYYSRLMLHARHISFVNPITHDPISFSSEVPTEFVILP